MYFSKILIAAFLTALIASTLSSFYQAQFVTPIIIAAEAYEAPEMGDSSAEEAWSPKEGTERSLFTLSANFLVAFAFATLLICAMLTKGAIRAHQGLLWGMAGYFCFFVAPSLGLAPEIPGMEAAQLEARQAWWWLTVMLSVAGLWLIIFSKIGLKLIGLLLIIAPHLYGAPEPERHGFINPNPEAIKALNSLWHDFIIQTALASGLLWLLIGSISACLVAKFIESTENQK